MVAAFLVFGVTTMGKSGIMGFVVVGLLVLGTIWLYNRFSGKSIADLGSKA